MMEENNLPLHDRVDRRALGLLLAFLTIAAFVSGCGKPLRDRAPVNGKVTYRGKPLSFGVVMFQPAAGQCATGDIQADGTFRMMTRREGEGVPVGKNAVRIACCEGHDPALNRGDLKTNTRRGEGSLGKSLIPEKYTSFDTSGITINVKPGENETVVLNLTD